MTLIDVTTDEVLNYIQFVNFQERETAKQITYTYEENIKYSSKLGHKPESGTPNDNDKIEIIKSKGKGTTNIFEIDQASDSEDEQNRKGLDSKKSGESKIIVETKNQTLETENGGNGRVKTVENENGGINSSQIDENEFVEVKINTTYKEGTEMVDDDSSNIIKHGNDKSDNDTDQSPNPDQKNVKKINRLKLNKNQKNEDESEDFSIYGDMFEEDDNKVRKKGIRKAHTKQNDRSRFGKTDSLKDKLKQSQSSRDISRDEGTFHQIKDFVNDMSKNKDSEKKELVSGRPSVGVDEINYKGIIYITYY